MPGSIKALRLHHMLLGGALTGAQMEAELGNALKAGGFRASVHQRTAMTAIAASASAMAAITGSPAAMAAVVASSTAMTAIAASASAMAAITGSPAATAAVVASSTAMTAIAASASAMAAITGSPAAMAAVVASSTAMTAIAANSVAKISCYKSDAALNAIAASATAMAALRAAEQYSIKTAIENGTGAALLDWIGTYIVLGASRATALARNVTLTTVRAGSGISGTIAMNGTPDALAIDQDVAIPLSAATNFVLSGSGTGAIYFGALRCDV